MPNPSWVSAAPEQRSACSHFPLRGSVLVRAWERPQGRALLVGGFAPAADFGAELEMGHGLGLAVRQRGFRVKDAHFKTERGFWKKLWNHSRSSDL